ncbi:hypothetical protein VZT92_024882 [Zoarces viviparus]|uniref:Uncharacterized protein n=1 Tax=Zoarces viviparus TaxID=48416 RepID=A0AAW1E2W8_ZOAVI
MQTKEGMPCSEVLRQRRRKLDKRERKTQDERGKTEHRSAIRAPCAAAPGEGFKGEEGLKGTTECQRSFPHCVHHKDISSTSSILLFGAVMIV